MPNHVTFSRWATLVALIFSTFLACGGSSAKNPGANVSAGTAGTAPSDAGDGGDGADGAQGGSATAGRAGSRNGGTGGRLGVGGSSGAGAIGGVGGVAGGTTGGLSGTAGSAGSAPLSPAGWTCTAARYDDGDCDCGCGVQDADCKRDDRVSECDRCECAGGCPGRVDPEATTKCLAPATGWTCRTGYYGDGACDCGCGVVDIDCEDDTIESCEECARLGGCGNGPCPSNIVAEDNSTCFTPATWLCEYRYGDGFCDCGCGIQDIDCESSSRDACDACPGDGCADGACTNILQDENAFCTTPPTRWVCPARLYNDGTQCDCGCGFPDPDCQDNSVTSCDKCNGVGSCSGQACPGTIDESANQRCIQPPPPTEWTCAEYSYADGYECDCGCGAPDPDCRTPDASSCQVCACQFGTCPDNIDPADPTKCGEPPPPPTGWLCSPESWSDDSCDCGCGVADPVCGEEPVVEWCQTCEGCAGGRCDFLDELDPAQCKITLPEAWDCPADTFHDSVCDCGCGALDADCPSAQKSVCAFCNAPGSCSNVACTNGASTINPDDNAVCN